MTEVLILKGSLDFEREIIVHFKHHIQEMEILLLAAPSIANRSKEDNIELS